MGLASLTGECDYYTDHPCLKQGFMSKGVVQSVQNIQMVQKYPRDKRASDRYRCHRRLHRRDQS